MASSPGYRAPDMAKAETEAHYGDEFREFEVDDVLERMSIGEALFVDMVANMGGDIMRTGISENALLLRMNRAFYDDPVEDFIAESSVLLRLIAESRKASGHDDAERVRLLRSARLCLWFAQNS
jgi:hypothetical protein